MIHDIRPVTSSDEFYADYAVLAVAEQLPKVISELEMIAEYLPSWNVGINRSRIKSVTRDIQRLNRMLTRASQVVAETRP